MERKFVCLTHTKTLGVGSRERFMAGPRKETVRGAGRACAQQT